MTRSRLGIRSTAPTIACARPTWWLTAALTLALAVTPCAVNAADLDHAPGPTSDAKGPAVPAPAREVLSTPAGPADARGSRAVTPAPPSPEVVTSDGKTIVGRELMRQQGDFRLNEALRNVPGVNRR